jgi:hypothetical protein
VGEIKTWVEKDVYLQVLEKEISVLKNRYDPTAEGTGHYNTAIGVLQNRVKELNGELNWPFPAKDSDWL